MMFSSTEGVQRYIDGRKKQQINKIHLLRCWLFVNRPLIFYFVYVSATLSTVKSRKGRPLSLPFPLVDVGVKEKDMVK